MFTAKCKSPACKKAEVIRRHNSPSATPTSINWLASLIVPNPTRPKSKVDLPPPELTDPPLINIQINAKALSAMSALVVIGSPVKLLSFLCVRLSIGETEAQEGQ